MGNVKIVNASAGSGKTYNLAYEYVRNVISDPSRYRHILAVTFTNKATEEMKRRILAKINELARGEEREYLPKLHQDLGLPVNEITTRASTVRSFILHDYNHFSIVTIDKFFQRIIRSFIKELGVDLNFNLELPVESLLGSAADRMIDDISTDETLRKWITAFVNDKIDDSRQWNIRGELLTLGSELFKEEYKRSREGWKTDKDTIQKIINKATAEAEKGKEAITSPAAKLLELAASNDLDVSDFSNGKMGPAGYAAKVAAGEIAPYGKRVTDTIESGRWCAAKSPKKGLIEPLAPQLTTLLEAVARAYDDNIRLINSASLLRENYRNFALLGDLRQKVAEVSKEENIVHISEINEMLAKLISGNDTPFVFEKAGNYYSHFMIDEFQDTSSLQWDNFLPLLKNAIAESEETPVMLVGDIKQSIYRWRGGDWGILARRADKEFDSVTKTSLQENFRSRPTVVGFINAVIGTCAQSENSKINALLDEALTKGQIDSSLHTQLTDTIKDAYADCQQIPNAKQEGGYVTVTYYDGKEKNPVPPVIEMVEQLQERGYRAGDIAILVRRNTEATRIAAMLLEHKQAHPDSPYCYDIITQDALIIGKSEVVNFVIACLRLSVSERDNINRAIYNRHLGRGFGEHLTESDTRLFARLRLMPPEEALENIVIHFRLGGNDGEISYLQALHEQILSFTKSTVADIPLFLAWWVENGSRKSIPMPSTGDAITIDTIHRSKGLGYKAVIIPYCNWSLTTKTNAVVWSSAAGENSTAEIGRFPVKYKKAMEKSHFAPDYYREYVMSQVDNLNLFYVALTRAKEELHIMLPTPGKSETERISTLLDSVITRSGEEARTGDMTGKITNTADGVSLRFGSPGTTSQHSARQLPRLLGYETTDTHGRMAIRLGSQRYLDEGAADEKLTPRSYGVLLHRLFEHANTFAEIEEKLAELMSNGILSPPEAEELQKSLHIVMEEETVKGWFDGTWSTVRNENNIITPGGETYRPDRVMIKEGEAVVIDYKFGLKELPAYASQVRRYASLLEQMGYGAIAGYVWYVSLGRVDKV